MQKEDNKKSSRPKKPTFELENDLIKKGYELIVGIDEVGRGPLAGPVVAAAVIPRNLQFTAYDLQTSSNDQKNLSTQISAPGSWDLIRDSKTLSEKQREKIFDFIQENFLTGIGICDHETIDRMNILEASFLAMKKAVASLSKKISNFQFFPPQRDLAEAVEISNEIKNPNIQSVKYNMQNIKHIILVDGNKKIPNFTMEQRAIVGGDKIVKSISAASIIAKVTRDRMMREMHEKYPQYGFDKHKGYGTKLHMEALKKYGPCKIHRKSFEPVRILVKIGK